MCKYYDTLKLIMGSRATSRPVIRSSNEDIGEITLASLDGIGEGLIDNVDVENDLPYGEDDDERAEDGAEDGSDKGGGDQHQAASQQLYQVDVNLDIGSPPRSKKRSSSDTKPAKRLKLPVDKKKPASLVETLVTSLEGQTASAERAAQASLALRESELAHRIQAHDAEVAMRQADLKLKQRTQRHAEIMRIAEFRRQLGIPTQEIVDYVDQATSALDN